MQPHQQRVVEELEQLEEKLGKLNEFIHESDLFNKLDKVAQIRLIQQATYMQAYSAILKERIDNF